MKIQDRICFLVAALIFSSGSMADDFYIGIDFGNLKFDQEFLVDTENIGLTAGYSWNGWGIESVVNFSDTKNDVSGGDQPIRMYHLYGTYQTEGQYYFKAKLGLANERYKVDNREGQEIIDDVHSGIARGVGIGFRLNSVKSELEYTWLGGSLQLLTIGLRYEFQ